MYQNVTNHHGEKLEGDSSRPRYLLTHWGKGYSFDPTGGKV